MKHNDRAATATAFAKNRNGWWMAICMVAVCGTGHAQSSGSQSMEERLRAQLRATTTQLQQAQAELAQLRAGPVATSGPTGTAPADELHKQLAETKTQLAAERARAQRLESAHSAMRRDAQSIAEQSSQYRDNNAQLLKNVQAAEAERKRLAAETQQQGSALQLCQSKNEQLYALGQEVLHAYETMDLGTVLSARQPFAAKARAKYGALAQQYGDRLYEGRFDAKPRNAATPTPE